MSAVPYPTGVLACPACEQLLEVRDSALVCAAHGSVGSTAEGFADLRRPRSGTSAELVAFWSSSDGYYDVAGGTNLDYDDIHHAAHRTLIDRLQRDGARRILDVGCGTAELAEQLAARLGPVDYVGIEVSPLALQRAAELGRPGRFAAADAEALPFGSGMFDAAVSLFALEHFSDPRAVLAQMARVVRPGGVVAVLTLAYDRPGGTIPSIRFGVASLSRRDPRNLAVYTTRRTRFAARQAGKQLRYLVDRRYAPFEIVRRPLVLEGRYESDMDVVHVVSGRAVQRTLQQLGLVVEHTTLPRGLAGFVRIPFGYSVIARRP